MTIRRETGPPIFVVKVSGGDCEGVKLAESCCIEDDNRSAINDCDNPVTQ